MNNATLIGRLVRDPELRYIPVSGKAVANFTLAVDRGLSKEKEEEMKSQGKPTADFIRITAWEGLAENCANHLAKGLLVAVQGRIQTGSYKDEEGRWVNTFDVVANQVKFLEWKNRDSTSNEDDNLFEGFHPTDNADIPF